MGKQWVVRPVVRGFRAEYASAAALHVRAGGHAVIWGVPRGKRRAPTRARLVFREPQGPREKDLGYWAILDLSLTRWSTIGRGALRGLAFARVPKDGLAIVEDRVRRDSIHPGATRDMLLDCRECAACCRDNHVVIDDEDLARFRQAGRSDLGRPPYVRRVGGKLVLRLEPSRDCGHLTHDKQCAIYSLRPGSCRAFPLGSEGCLYSREEELGIVDGLSDP